MSSGRFCTSADTTLALDTKTRVVGEFAKEVSGYGREEQVFERDEDALNR